MTKNRNITPEYLDRIERLTNQGMLHTAGGVSIVVLQLIQYIRQEWKSDAISSDNS